MPAATKGFIQHTLAPGVPASAAPALVPRCTACGLWRGCNSPKMPVTGEGRRGILILAEAPGKSEDEQGEQLVGKAGQLLRRYLRGVGIDLDRDCWKTNSIICHKAHNVAPTDDELAHCRPNLTRTLRDLRPRVVIPLGGAAVKTLVGPLYGGEIGPIGRWVGWQVPDGTLNSWICPTWHPSFIAREHEEPALSLWFARHLEEACELEGRPWGEDGRPDYGAGARLIMGPDEAAAALDKIPDDAGIMAFDFETDRLKPDHKDAWIVCCSVAWGRGPVPEIVLAYPWLPATRRTTERLIFSGLPKIVSNLQFETRWSLKEFGRPVPRWRWDTMQAAHIQDNRHEITGLKFQAYVKLGQPYYAGAVEPYFQARGSNLPNRIKEVGMPALLKYCALDSSLEYRLAWKQAGELGVTLV